MQSNNPFRTAMQVSQASHVPNTPPPNHEAQSYSSESKQDHHPATHLNTADYYVEYQDATRQQNLAPVNRELGNDPPPSYPYEAPPNPPPTTQTQYFPPQQPPASPMPSQPAIGQRGSQSPVPPAQCYPPLQQLPATSSMLSQPVIDQRSRSPGPSAGPSFSSSSFGSGLSSRLNPRDPLNPPPASFSRPLPFHLHPGPPGTFIPAFAPFPPMRLFSHGENIDKGFPMLLPACSVPVHPFSQRDVQEGDWTRFLEDLQIRGHLTGREQIVSNVLPMALSMGLVGGLLMTRGIQGRMKSKKNGPVGELVDIWNQHFFHVRRMHVILAHGPENISGDVDGPAPDYSGPLSRSRSYSPDSDDDGHNHHNRHNRRQELHQRRAERWERIQERRGRRQERHEKYRLVVLSI